MKPLLVVLAGPNGAGKSTFFQAYLSHLDLPFLNADKLARKVGLDAYESARQIASIRDEFVRQRQGFILETVFSDPVGDKVDVFHAAAEAEYDVHLIFIGIRSGALSVDRVAHRVAAGGHDVPTSKLEARFSRTLDNLVRAIRRLPRVTIYDNSSYEEPYRFLAEFRDSRPHRRKKRTMPAWFAGVLKRVESSE